MLWLTSVLKRSVSLSESEDMQQAKKQVKQLAVCQDLGPDKLYSTLRSMTHQSSICAFWLWPGGKLSDHQAVGLRSSHAQAMSNSSIIANLPLGLLAELERLAWDTQKLL